MSTDQHQRARDAAERLQERPEQARIVKSSVSLTGDLHDRWRESGVSLPELVRRGLDAAEPDPLADLRKVVREAVAAELDARGLTAGGVARTVAREARTAAPRWP